MSVAQAISAGASLLSGFASNNTKSSGGSAAGTNTFLNLLVAQITHQNPMEPMDNDAMVTQLAQFNTVEKLEALNENVNSMMMYQNLLNSSNLIGKEVVVLDPLTGHEVSGKVETIKIQGGFPGVVINDTFYDVSYVQQINN